MRLIILFLLMCSLTACIPAPYGRYYKPSYSDGSAKLIKEYCRGEAGPPSTLTFKVTNKVNFTVTTAKSYSDKNRSDVPLIITVNVPSETTFQFLSDELQISDLPKIKSTIQVSANVEMRKDDVVDLDHIGPLTKQDVGKFIQIHPNHVVSEARVDFNLGNKNFHPETISLQLPTIYSRKTPIIIPPMSLNANTKDKGWWRYEASEHQQLRQNRYAHCLKDTPHLHCANIIQIIDESFRTDTAGFEISGHLAMADFVQHPTLSGRLNYAVSNIDPWKFTSNEIRGEDVKTTEVHYDYFDHFSVFFGWYDVPMVTVVKGVKSGTIIRIVSTLGDKYRSKYSINLPLLLIDGHEYKLNTIDLDLKLLDGGIEPFNC